MVNLENYEEYLLMEADGELNETERKALYDFLEQHPELKKELDAYMSVKLVPDTNLIYTDKNQLLKKEQAGGRIIGFNRMFAYGAAAMLVIALAIFALNNRPEPVQIAKTEPVIRKTVTTPQPTVVEETPAEEKILHSPVSPVTNEKAAQQAARPVLVRAKTKKPETPVAQPAHQTIAQVENNTKVTEKCSTPKSENLQRIPSVAATETLAMAEPDQNQEPDAPKKNLLASLPVREEKLLGLNDFSDKVTEKVEEIKAVRAKFKDADISFKIGKKELFVVSL